MGHLILPSKMCLEQNNVIKNSVVSTTLFWNLWYNCLILYKRTFFQKPHIMAFSNVLTYETSDHELSQIYLGNISSL